MNVLILKNSSSSLTGGERKGMQVMKGVPKFLPWVYVVKLPLPVQRLIQKICGHFGHVVGDTGYMGGLKLYCYCRNCNKLFLMPLSEMPSKAYLKDIYDGKD
jgi:hypothetical protein